MSEEKKKNGNVQTALVKTVNVQKKTNVGIVNARI